MLQKFDPRNRDLIVNVSGKLSHRDEAGVSPFDSVVQGGDAVWEGLRLYQGRIFRLEQHLDRLVSSAKALAFAHIPARESIVTEIRRTLEANGMYDGVHIRLTLTRGVKVTSGMDPRLNQSGSTLIVLAEHKPPVYSTEGLTLVTSSLRRFPPDCCAGWRNASDARPVCLCPGALRRGSRSGALEREAPRARLAAAGPGRR